MAGAKFETTITALDEASAPLKRVAAEVKQVAKAADLAGHSLGHMDRPGVFSLMAGHVRLLRSHFKELGAGAREVGQSIREHIGEAAKSIVELLPAVGALGAIGSVGGLFELAEHASEAASELETSARKAGVSAEQFAAFSTAAKMTDISAESMGTSLFRLNRTMSDAAHGKNKDAAALFRHLHISLKGAHGQAADVTTVMLRLADAFKHTSSETTRAAMAQALFGKAGNDLLPLLDQGSAAIKEYARISAEVNFVPKGADKDQLEAYHVSWIELGLAVKGLTDEIGAKLAPVLRPVIDQMRQWIVKNREWLTTKITENIKEFADYLKQVDWQRVIDQVRDLVDGFKDAVGAVGGLRRILEILIGLKVLGWARGILGGLTSIARDARTAKEALEAVRAAAVAAGTAEAFGPLIASVRALAFELAPIAAFIAVMWPTKTAAPAQDEHAPDDVHEDAVTMFRKGRRDRSSLMPNSVDLSRAVYARQQADAPKGDELAEFTKAYAPLQQSFAGMLLGLPPITLPGLGPNAIPPPNPTSISDHIAAMRRAAEASPDNPLSRTILTTRDTARMLEWSPSGDGRRDRDSTPAAAAPSRDGEVKVRIDINGLPPGSRASATSSGATPPPDLNIGYANPMGYAY